MRGMTQHTSTQATSSPSDPTETNQMVEHAQFVASRNAPADEVASSLLTDGLTLTPGDCASVRAAMTNGAMLAWLDGRTLDAGELASLGRRAIGCASDALRDCELAWIDALAAAIVAEVCTMAQDRACVDVLSDSYRHYVTGRLHGNVWHVDGELGPCTSPLHSLDVFAGMSKARPMVTLGDDVFRTRCDVPCVNGSSSLDNYPQSVRGWRWE